MPPLTPEERRLRARKAALTRSATEDTRAMTEPARSTFQQSFIDAAWNGIGPYQSKLVSDHPDLPESTLLAMVEQEVMRRAAALRKAFYTDLGLASARARRKKGDRAATADETRSPTPSGVERNRPELDPESTGPSDGGR